MNRIPVIGLEIHVRLATRTKLFCGCENLYGREPNRLTCPVCSGQPGALPVLNAEALRLAVLAGLAFGARIPETITFDRKNYFYPDLPKGYQITQIARPVASGGTVAYRDEKGDIRSVPLIRAHLEEDAGKTIHPPGGDASLVDLNRAGTPLLEIVTEPALTTPEGARRFLKALKRLCLHLGISDCDMEKGSLRCDANVSLRMPGEALPEGKTEIKNLNSFHHVESALRHEIERQGRLLDEGILSARETRSWNETVRRTEVLRTKEELEDYRYFPEPDLPMTALSAEWVSSLEGELPELPLHREDRYRGDLGLTADEAETLVASPDRAAYFEAVIDSGASPREAAKWIRTRRARGDGATRLRYGCTPRNTRSARLDHRQGRRGPPFASGRRTPFHPPRGGGRRSRIAHEDAETRTDQRPGSHRNPRDRGRGGPSRAR